MFQDPVITANIIRVFAISSIAFVVAMAWTPILTGILYKYKLGKQIREDENAPIYITLHKKKAGTPTMGGLLIWITVVGLAGFFWLAGFLNLDSFISKLNFLSRSQTWLPMFSLITAALVGLFDDIPLPEDRDNPLDYLNVLTLSKMKLGESERDMIVMHHEFIAEYPDKKEYITSTLVEFGIPNGDSAISRTVALPAAIAVKMILNNKIKLTGVHIPVTPEIYNPILDELFWGIKGEGSFVGNKKICVSQTNKLSKAFLATGFPYDVAVSKENNLDHFARMIMKCMAIRRAGSAALDLCYLANGIFDGFWELKLHPWDTAAAMVIVQEAGGKITKFDGTEFNIFDKKIIASNGIIHQQMLSVLNEK